MSEQTKDEVRTTVREQYGSIALSTTGASCCAPGSCGEHPRRCEGAEPRVHPRLAPWLGRRELRRLGHHRSREAGRREVVLRPVLLCAGDLGMIEPAARGAWRELEAKLRPFIARRSRA
ncbi:MAG TPA: hypothetical protein VN033_16040 [Vulgatibacter sp.]|nr:hypothetical protein [Vulgatibacter sp.]